MRTIPDWTGRMLVVAGLCLTASGIFGAKHHAARNASRGNQPSAFSDEETAPIAFVPPQVGSTDSLGQVIHSEGNAGGGSQQLLNLSVHAGSGKLTCTSVNQGSDPSTVTITYTAAGVQVHVVVHSTMSANTLAITLDADEPGITSADFGSFPTPLSARKIAVPYYSSDVWYSTTLKSFLNAWWDFEETHGTFFNGSQVRYDPRTDGSLVQLHEKLMVADSSNVDDVFPSLPGPASPYMSELAGRTVFDIWSGSFARIRDDLKTLGGDGVTDCVGIIHNWQHGGYDNQLPQHYPANESLGGDEMLKAAVDAGKSDGCLMALHENYIDYYPNYQGFDPAGVASKSDGQRSLAWLNRGTGVQSFQAKPSWMVKNASTQSPHIKQLYGTNASFLDVNSAVTPYNKRDMDPAAPYAGTMQAWLKAAGDLWSYERKTYGGPALGEGLNHWYYTGRLDGVEAQLGTGDTPLKEGASLALFVDFDLLRIHPLQVNHGMGYYARWTKSGTSTMTTTDFDAYRMQEVIYGHAPFVTTPYWDNIPYAMVETGLIAPVAKRYGTERASTIRYMVGENWTSPSDAAIAGEFDRVMVKYANGLQVVANAAASTMQWDGYAIPQYGWVAKGQDVLAYTALCGDTICDFAQTPTSIFANARSPQDFGTAVNSSDNTRINRDRKVIDFGMIRTNTMISLRLESGRWVLQSFGNRNANIKFDGKFLRPPSLVQSEGGSGMSLTPESEPNGWWSVDFNGATSYSWTASSPTLPMPQ